ncbi:glycine cleavage system aminomethyltransferase GcvT [Algisphaera agarilytica]|uniref:aminomethyltransferase n=1 Tax=Algisphaera agarilytica TaxID=1385975 RepID=A0A7X0HAI4_9BACT|nr:glycine cleavage system aminomethyltransferase GcvT [Algisphaera agarilytica]MBB6431151.1 aminomethyltransferase [Algisphaera agarilytica]
MALLDTPFKKFHAENGAKLVDFAGWEMPLHYGSIIDEHNHTRNSGSIFDVSHMGRFKITGRHARKFLETVLTRKISNMKTKTCRYALVCNEQGGVKDDVLVYRYDDHWMLVVNASNRTKLLAHFDAVKESGSFAIKLVDITEGTAMLAVQGPEVIEKIGEFSKEIPTLKNYTFALKNLLILKMTVSRTGYTGEDGVEVILGANMAGMAMKLLLKEKGEAAAIKPAGLGARDSLRLEAGMPLYGHELDEETDPLSAGLGFAVSLEKHVTDEDDVEIPRFIGQDALEKINAEGTPKTLVGMKIDGQRTPRQGAEIKRDGQVIGTVTSGCLSPTLGCPIAMAYLQPNTATTGDTVTVAVGSSEAEAELVPLPFYKRGR